MRERVITTFIAVVLLIGIFIGAVKVYTDISVNKALITFNQAMNARDYDTANKLYLNYIGRSRFRTSAAEITSKAGRDAVNLMTNEYAGQETCEEARDTLNSIIIMGYSPTPAERELVRNSFNTMFTQYYYEAPENKQDIEAKLNIYKTLKAEEFFYEDRDFFEKSFNDIMADIISEKVTVEEAAAAYSILSPVYPESRNFAVQRLNQLYTSYNEEKIKYQSAVDVYTAVKNSGMAAAVAENNLIDINKLFKSKTAFYNGVEAMNNADYLSAYKNFDEVKEFDKNFEQKNAYFNEMLSNAKNAAIKLIETKCAAHEFAAARQVITDYDKYVDSAELRGKAEYIDKAEEHYKKMLEAVNAIRIHSININDGSIEISWTNKSSLPVERVEFNFTADGEDAAALYFGEYEAGEYVEGAPDYDTFDSYVENAVLQSVVISYANGDEVIIEKDYITYITD